MVKVINVRERLLADAGVGAVRADEQGTVGVCAVVEECPDTRSRTLDGDFVADEPFAPVHQWLAGDIGVEAVEHCAAELAAADGAALGNWVGRVLREPLVDGAEDA